MVESINHLSLPLKPVSICNWSKNTLGIGKIGMIEIENQFFIAGMNGISCVYGNNNPFDDSPYVVSARYKNFCWQRLCYVLHATKQWIPTLMCVVLRKQHFLHGSTRFQLKTGTDQMLRMVPDVTDDSTMDTELIKTVRWRNFEQMKMFQATSGPNYLQHDCGCLSRFILCCIQILPIDHIASFSRHFKHTEYPITANNSIDR